MARRESQGLQITLIIFVMLTVVLAVTTYIFWSRSENLSQERPTLQNGERDAQAAADTGDRQCHQAEDCGSGTPRIRRSRRSRSNSTRIC